MNIPASIKRIETNHIEETAKFVHCGMNIPASIKRIETLLQLRGRYMLLLCMNIPASIKRIETQGSDHWGDFRHTV